MSVLNYLIIKTCNCLGKCKWNKTVGECAPSLCEADSLAMAKWQETRISCFNSANEVIFDKVDKSSLLGKKLYKNERVKTDCMHRKSRFGTDVIS
jgi:hypothetical protein